MTMKMFFADGSSKFGYTSVVTYDIKLTDGARPFQSRPYRAGPVQRVIIDAKVK